MSKEPLVEINFPPSSHDKFKRFLLDILETIGLAVVLFLSIDAISARVRVDGYSMRPTLENGEFVLVNRLAYKTGGDAQRGDIIVFRSMNSSEDLIKRVIGLPGETIHIENGQVYIDNDLLSEPYIASPPSYTCTWMVSQGYLFVLGDNRNDSSDSHVWGLLPVENVIGRAVLVYWPLNNFMFIEHNHAVMASP